MDDPVSGCVIAVQTLNYSIIKDDVTIKKILMHLGLWMLLNHDPPLIGRTVLLVLKGATDNIQQNLIDM